MKNLSIRRLPQNLEQKDEILFKNELLKEFPRPSVKEFDGIWCSYLGVLFKGCRISSISFPSGKNEYYSKWINQFKFTLKTYLTNRRRYEFGGIWVIDSWSLGYFHWFTDALTRLESITNLLRAGDIYLPYNYKGVAYIEKSLSFFPMFNVRYIDFQTSIKFTKLVVPLPTSFSSGNYNDGLLRSLNRRLTASQSLENNRKNERIYISRRQAKTRFLINEEEIIGTLKDFKFEFLCLEDISWEDQAGIFAQAKHIVSIHGAGLTNMLLMKEGQSILEIRRANDELNNCYFSMASALNLDYWYLNCDRVSDISGDDNVLVSPTALRNVLSEMFN